ncbi:MAG: hypothetical protein RR746_00765 [Lachnospiraceae bacterium]
MEEHDQDDFSRNHATDQPSNNYQKRTRYLMALLIVLFCFSLTALIVTLMNPSPVNQVTQSKKEATDKKISEDMQLLSVNEGPRFANAHSKGDLRIEIVSDCHYAYGITYLLAETQKPVLKTGLIQPGEYVLDKPLDIPLDSGIYPIIALFTAYDIKTKEQVGEAAQAMTFYVEE